MNAKTHPPGPSRGVSVWKLSKTSIQLKTSRRNHTKVTLARRSLPNIALPQWAACNLAWKISSGNNFRAILLVPPARPNRSYPL